MFDIAQWGLGMDDSGPVTLTPPSDPKALRGLTMVYENGIVMKHEDFGRNYGVRFIGEKGTIDISRSYLDSNPASIVSATIQAGEKRLYASDDHYADWINAAKNGTKVEGSTLYVNFPPCTQCASSILQAGITQIICPNPEKAPERWRANFLTANNLFFEAGVQVLYYLDSDLCLTETAPSAEHTGSTTSYTGLLEKPERMKT
jgi:tRNA(Arg) A34 adenosine deaminase TadA